jgi:hypothetical protein
MEDPSVWKWSKEGKDVAYLHNVLWNPRKARIYLIDFDDRTFPPGLR